jgi:integrase
MAIFKRGRVYWYHYLWNGRHIQASTKQGNPRVTRQMEAAHRTRLAKGEVGIVERKPAPILKEFSQRFIDYVQTRSAEKPATIRFYAEKLARILEYEPLAEARLDVIDESLIERFVQWRSQQASRAGSNRKKKTTANRGRPISAATVNRSLATLRKLLRLAHEWRLINRVPRIRLLPGEHNREFILNYEQEDLYLEMARQPLKDVAMLILDAGLRIGEVLALQWRDIHLTPAPGARFGYLTVHDGKTRFARRNVPLTIRVSEMLKARKAQYDTPWVFAEKAVPMLGTSLDHLHKQLRDGLNLPSEFVLHSLRHTYGTRLGEAGADAFTIMRLMGHSSVTVSQRYVHPTPESLERAVERLEGLNQVSKRRLRESESTKRKLPATISATPRKSLSVSY